MSVPIKLNNDGKRIKVTLRKNKDYYTIELVYRVMIEGKRYRESKKIGNPVYLKASTRNKDVLELKEAMELRDILELENKNKDRNILVINKLENFTLVRYMEKQSNNYKGNTRNVWKHAISHAKSFFKNTLLTDITRQLSNDYAKYLRDSLFQNTANLYLQKYKQTIKRALIDEIIEKDITPTIKIPIIQTEKEYLTLDEVKIINNTPINDENIKNSFLFSCFTGLRFGDLQQITFENIKNGKLEFRMQKTKEPIIVELNKTAKSIIEHQKTLAIPNNKIFHLPVYEGARAKLKRFIKHTGIKKNIAFHTARHTFATMNITYGNDLYTVSKMLGHKDIKVTQVYAKLVNQKMKEAVDRLPIL